MMIAIFPANVIAASSEEDLTAKETQELDNIETQTEEENTIDTLLESIIVEEDISKRGESEKHWQIYLISEVSA